MTILVNIPTGNRLTIPTGVSAGRGPVVLFFEDFETPTVVGYDQGTLPTRWLGSDTGFGSNRWGLDEKSSGNWEDGTSSTQAFNTQYTNSGACTKSGEIATIDINTVTYKFTIQVAYDKAVSGPYGSPSGDFNTLLCALEGGFDRQDFAAGWADFQARAIVTLTGSAPNDDGFHVYSGTYTTDPVTDAGKSGYDLAIATDGATSSGNIVSTKVEII